ncbi:hypothetical protein EUTSA_v10013033mg [Eutrema salsugineum]|uniref:Proton pump-interactor 1 n=1 Tax=Eutrema salsugineum TaxID=72664 RepID=V4LKY6_EUTSA|nr:hypothetical protein EUTSA_v10013033mg [Eutrema salsugineum]
MVGNSDGFEVAPTPLESKPEQNGKGDKVSIKFGSHNEPSKSSEETGVSKSDVPKDVSEDWPAEKKLHAFYFVKQRSYEDPKIKAKLDQLDQEYQKLNSARAGVFKKLKAKRDEKSELFDLLEPLKSERKGFNSMFDEKRKEMEPLQQALGKLRSNDGGTRGPGICSSEQELNDMIRGLEYRIQHESNTLNEEKQLLKEIRQLEGTRDKVIANAALRAKIKESLGHKEDIQDQVKSMGSGLDGVKKERQAISARIGELSEKIKASKDGIQVLEDELKIVTEKRDKTYSNIQEIRKQRDAKNANFYQSRGVLNKARDLAAQKRVEDLETLSHAEGEKFMSLWHSDKKFKEDYEKRLLPSLDARQLSRDGRMRNPEEKPLITPEPSSKPMPSETEVVPKAKTKQPKEDPVSAPKPDVSVPQKESGNKAKDAGKAKETKPISDEEEVYGLGKPLKEESKPVDEATLREMRRQEEIAKAKQAMERKKKQAANSLEDDIFVLVFQERERKAKKDDAVEPEEVPEASVPEKEEVEDQEMEKPMEEKASKGKKQIRNRIHRRGLETPLPRPSLKRKKSSNNYLVWAIPAALVVLVLLVLGYYYAL